MLDRTARLLFHYLAQARISRRSCAVRDREVLASRVAREKDSDVVYLGW